jgi:hypothetical protein
LYELKQSPRAWFHVIAEVLTDFDFKQSESVPCIWIHKNTNGEQTYIALYVDDLIIAGENENEICTIKHRLSARFEMKDLGIARKFLGMEIEYGSDGSIKIHQNQYIQQLLDGHGMGECNPVTTPLDMSVKLTSIKAESEAAANPQEYVQIVGGLTFAAWSPDPTLPAQLVNYLNSLTIHHQQICTQLNESSGTFKRPPH